jgi:hypothetical protein
MFKQDPEVLDKAKRNFAMMQNTYKQSLPTS